MKKVPIEYAINEIKTNPHFDPRLRWALRDHCENTHQTLLDALKEVSRAVPNSELLGGRLSAAGIGVVINKVREAIEAASFVEVDE